MNLELSKFLCFGWSNESSSFSFFFLGAMTPTTYITTLYMCIFGVICVYANWTRQLNFITIHLWKERPLEEKSWVPMPMFQNSNL
jgi:hypothetical protein